MKLLGSIATVGGLTLVSRVFGFIRDMLIASCLGVSFVTDAFFIAFKLPNFFRRFFAEGAFNAAFVPLFSGMLVSERKEKSKEYAEHVMTVMLTVLIGFVLIFEIFMPTLLSLTAPGLAKTPERFALAVQLSRITFPYILWISLAALCSGVLNSLGKFADAAACPILLNITMIAALGVAAIFSYDQAYSLAVGVVFAGVLQFLWLWISLSKNGMSLKLTWPKFTPDIRRLVKNSIPGALGAGVVQINLFMDMVFASFLPTGAISYLFYADRLNQLPLGVIGIAISTALLPALSKQIKSHKLQEAQYTQNRTLEMALAITLPAMVGLMVLAAPIVIFLFERGAFTRTQSLETAHTLAAFVSGLPAYVMIKVLSTSFFAREDTKTTMIIGVIAVSVNFILNILLIGPFMHVGLAFSTSLAAWVNAILLGYILFVRGWFSFDKILSQQIVKLLLSSFNMGCLGFLLSKYCMSFFQQSFLVKCVVLCVMMGSCFMFYIASARVLGVFRFRKIYQFLKSQTH